MKLNITKKQWYELSRKAKGTWNDWCKKNNWCPVSFTKREKYSVIVGLPDISAMLEFLIKHNPKRLYILTNATLTIFKNEGWKWETGKPSNVPNPNSKGYKEPLNALWQAVRKILEK